jgi:PAS domain S-box-containing protein
MLEAKTSIDKDLAYRKWVTEQGGVNITPTEKTTPNSQLIVPNYYAHYRADRNGTLFRYSIIWTIGICGILALRSNLRRSSASLLASENRFRMLIEQAPDGIVVFDGNTGKITAANIALERLFGCGRNELLNRGLLPFYTEEQPDGRPAEESMLENTQRVLAGEEVTIDRNIRSANGKILLCEVHLALLPSEQGRLIRGSFIDITQRSENERQIRDIAKRLELATTTAHLGVWDWNVTNNTMVWDATMMAIYGYTQQSFPGGIEAWQQGLHPDDRDATWEACLAALRGECGWDYEFRIMRPDGTTRWIKAIGEVVTRDQDGSPARMLGINRDITARKQSEQKLRQSYDLMSYIIKYNTSALAVHDKDLKYLFVSERYLEDYKLEDREIIGKHHYDVFPDLPQKWRDIHQTALAGIISKAENDRYEKEDGSVAWTTWECRPWYEANGEVGGFIVYTEVVTDRIRAEEQKLLLQQQLHQAQKMESIGQLAGGVAHDFNNILTVIGGYCSLLQMDNSLSKQQNTDVTAIASSVEKAAQLTHGLLAFSRKQPMIMKQVDLNDVIQHIHKFMARIIGEDILIRTECSGIMLPVYADWGQMEQVLINLATNARDAMANGGEFTVRSELVSLNTSLSDFNSIEIPSGNYALLTTSDTGTGINKEDLEHIFEPFFTTKDVGKGTGLGMSIIYGIITQHNGYINVSSKVGHGTTFQIYLPIQEKRDEPLVTRTEVVLPTRGNETILVAEDDPGVRMLVSKVLESYGYEVIPAVDGVDAIEKFRIHQERIKLVLMDMIMPNKNGKETYEEIRIINPDIKVLFSSGYSADFIESRGVKETGIELIMKPVHPTELLKKVRAMLDA